MPTPSAQTREHPPAAPGRTILLYDGLCPLCNGFVRFLLRQDRRQIFFFAPLQGALAQTLLTRHGIDPTALDTVVLVLAEGTPAEWLLVRSDAATQALVMLGGGWALWARILQRLPRGLREARYRFVARWRYRIFGKYAACPLPAQKHAARFLQ
jgi:predicted DCC family thiol-disulfide oxidoreductase YuxK